MLNTAMGRVRVWRPARMTEKRKQETTKARIGAARVVEAAGQGTSTLR
jgi:hypothetical protein